MCSHSHIHRTGFCSCLTAKTDRGFTHFDNEAVAAFMLEFCKLGPAEFVRMGFEEFKFHYRNATNQMVRQSAYYLALPEAERLALEEFLPTRCAGCGFHVFRLFRERSEQMQEAA